MVKHMDQLEVGDVLINKITKELHTIGDIHKQDVSEGKNFYFPNFGYVRFRAMKKIFLTVDGGKFLIN